MRQDKEDGDSVVSIKGFMNAARFNAVNEVEAYWEAIRAGRLVPRRADIDPRGIERALEYAFILERVAPGIARLRIAGSHMSDIMGMEVRGMPLSAFVTPDGRNKLGEILEQVFDSPAKATVDLYSEGSMGRPEVRAKLLLLPMKSDLGDVSRALGCFATVGELGRTPRRFEITGSRVQPLLGDFMAQTNADTDTHGSTSTTPADADRSGAEPAPRVVPARPARARRDDTASGPGTHATPSSDYVSAPPARQDAPGPRLRPGPRPYLRVVDTDGN